MVCISGLPAAGRAEFAQELTHCLDGHLLSKEGLRRTLFPADSLSLSPEKESWLYEVLLKATAWNLDVGPKRTVVLDAQSAELHPLTVPGLFRFSRAVGHDLHFIECVRHPAGRERLLHRYGSAQAEEHQIPPDRVHVVQLTEPPAASVQTAMSLLMPRGSDGQAEAGKDEGHGRIAMVGAS